MITLKLKDPTLLETQAYVNGVWIDSEIKFDVLDPTTGALVAEVTDLDVAAAAKAIDAAHAAGPGWAALTGKEHGAILRRWHDLMVQNTDDLATILTAEMGQPWPEVRDEILYDASFIELFAEEDIVANPRLSAVRPSCVPCTRINRIE